MYDNNYPNNDRLPQDNLSEQKQDTPVHSQSLQSQPTQNQGGYGGYDRNQYGRNPYGSQNYGQNLEHNPYGNHQGYYRGQNTAGTSGSAENGNRTEAGTGSYHYGNTYPNYVQMDADRHKKKKEKRQRGKGTLKKVALCMALGLMFGLCAGVGVYVVQTVTGVVIGRSTAELTQEDKVLEAGEEAVEAAQAMADAIEQADTEKTDGGIHVTESINTVVADVSEVVKEVMPAIVSINNHYTEKMSYFGQTMTSEADASGSGIIVGQNDTELLIVSNYHVIAEADELTVQFVEGSEAKASVKGTDADMDLAVIAVPIADVDKATLQEIAVATLGDSDSLTVGEPAIAIGNSLGYGQSVTTGVISALNRSIQLSDGTDGTFIQTDAAINPGNSGGALLNIKGEVVGINSNKIGGSAVEGMGYAIPISAASPIIAELMLKETKNKVAEEERGYLGISGISVTQEVSEAYGMPEGVYISQVYESTAAAAAGLRKGDIIVEFDGDKISSMDALQKELEFYAKGDTVEITVMSPGVGGYESRTVRLTLGNKA